jgi:dihydroorotase
MMTVYGFKQVFCALNSYKEALDVVRVGSKLQLADDYSETPVEWLDNTQGRYLFPALSSLLVDAGLPLRKDVYTGKNLQEAMHKGGFAFALLDSEDAPLDEEGIWNSLMLEFADSDFRIEGSVALTRGGKGQELSEVQLLAEQGARFFSLGKHLPQRHRVLESIFRYASLLDTVLLVNPLEAEWADNISIAEGEVADALGMKGIPEEAETIAVFRILKLLEKWNVRVHFRQITLPESLAMIQQAREKGLPVSCDVSLWNLLFDDQTLYRYDAEYHFNPCLRNTRQELLAAVRSGAIQAISVTHSPRIAEDKWEDYEASRPGSSLLEITLSLVQDFLIDQEGLKWSEIIPLLSNGPLNVLGEGDTDNWILWNKDHKYHLTEDFLTGYRITSSPYMGETLSGQVEALLVNENWL